MAEDILQKGFGVGMPKNTNLPFFAYGFFKSDELAYHSIEKYVDKEKTKSIIVNGFLYEKDGIPVFSRKFIAGKSPYSVQGDLIFFTSNTEAEEAYNVIKEIEPGNIYCWGTINLYNNQEATAANVLYASYGMLNNEDNTLKGSIMLKRSVDRVEGHADPADNDKGAAWHGYCDALFTEGMKYLQEKFFDNPAFDNLRGPFILSNQSYYTLFGLQMAYIFLWTIIERHNSIKYGLNLKSSSQRSLMAQDDLFKEAVKRIGDDFSFNYTGIFASDSGRSRSFSEDWEEKLETYYQIRCNVAHRGKGGHDATDYPKLKGAFFDMFAIMQYMLKKELKKYFDGGEYKDYTEEDALYGIERLKSISRSRGERKPIAGEED